VLGIGTKAVGGLVGHGHGRVHERVDSESSSRPADGELRLQLHAVFGGRVCAVASARDYVSSGGRSDQSWFARYAWHAFMPPAIRLAPTTTSTTVQVCAPDQLECRLAGFFDRNLNA
jgi:hypothetical protein